MDKEKLQNLLQGISLSPELDALFFLQEHPHPSPQEIENLILNLKENMPLSKILGHKGFWNLDFIDTIDVLSPRPDTEILIESILKKYPKTNSPLKFLDIGTGSGCLAITLKHIYKNACVVAVDISKKALQIAKENAKKIGVEIIFKEGSLFDTAFMQSLGKFDIALSNPPYIPQKEIPPLKLKDPLLALDGGETGLNCYLALSAYLKNIAPHIFLEIGIGQEESVKNIFKNYTFITTHRDYNSIPRIMEFKS